MLEYLLPSSTLSAMIVPHFQYTIEEKRREGISEKYSHTHITRHSTLHYTTDRQNSRAEQSRAVKKDYYEQ